MSDFIKVLLKTSCLIGFIFNSLATFKSYLLGATSSSQVCELRFNNHQQIQFPVVVVCQDRQVMNAGTYTLEEYLDGEWTLNKAFVFVELPKSLLMKNVTKDKAYSVKEILTTSNGLCFCFKFKAGVNVQISHP